MKICIMEVKKNVCLFSKCMSEQHNNKNRQLLSQIGWTENKNAASPSKKISMEKIFVDVDTNGGNGGGTFVWEITIPGEFGKNLLHSKIPHRTDVCKKIVEYLEE